MIRPLNKKWIEILHLALSIKEAKAETVKDSFQNVKDCIVHAQIQSNKMWKSSFSSWINASEPVNVSSGFRFFMVFLLVLLEI